ncbi:MAG: hypothetical protein ACTS22_08505 [Phycisphaerales bacterium]
MRTVIAVVAAGLAVAPAAFSQQLVGVAFRDPSFSGNTQLHDLDAATGAASNGRFLGTDAISGIALAPDGTLFGWTDEFAEVNGVPVDGGLVTIDLSTGATSLVGNVSPFPSGAVASEGDIDFNPITGELFGVTSNQGVSLLFTIDPATGANTEVGIPQIPGTDFSGMAFDNAGNLWVLDTGTDFDPATRASTLRRISTADASILESIPLSVALGTTGGMDFDPNTGELYIADGDFLGTNNLYTADLTTGLLTLVGATGLDGAPTGFGGLADIEFIPAPGAGSLLALAGLGAVRRRRTG